MLRNGATNYIAPTYWLIRFLQQQKSVLRSGEKWAFGRYKGSGGAVSRARGILRLIVIFKMRSEAEESLSFLVESAFGAFSAFFQPLRVAIRHVSRFPVKMKITFPCFEAEWISVPREAGTFRSRGRVRSRRICHRGRPPCSRPDNWRTSGTAPSWRAARRPCRSRPGPPGSPSFETSPCIPCKDPWDRTSIDSTGPRSKGSSSSRYLKQQDFMKRCFRVPRGEL